MARLYKIWYVMLWCEILVLYGIAQLELVMVRHTVWYVICVAQHMVCYGELYSRVCHV